MRYNYSKERFMRRDIFAVLSLTVFALLVLATVKADSRMSAESTNAIKAYYEADLEAEQILGELRTGKEVEGVKVSLPALPSL